MDLSQFAQNLDELRKEALSRISKDDFNHLKKLEKWGRLCTTAGYATAWIVPNPVSAFLLSQGRFSRFAIVAHHVLHKGYERVPGATKKYTSRSFAKGKRRFLDWIDWIDPQAWELEHNVLHHFHLGEDQDPDLLEEVARKNCSNPLFSRFKLMTLFNTACMWKYSFYAPSTLKQLHRCQKKMTPKGQIVSPKDFLEAFNPTTQLGRDVWLRSLLPYSFIQFVLMPSLFIPLSPLATINTLINSLFAETLTNIHAFIMIVPNHAGEDLYRFTFSGRSKEQFYLRQILGSTNYNCGSDLNDFFHGFLNYQIEHHLWPDLPLYQYKWLQPKVKALCEKYGIPYKQESINKRLVKMAKVFIQKEKMKVYEESTHSVVS